MKSFIEEFKAFAVKGNVIDLAVSVVIGTAFGKIVASLVDTIIMPIVGIVIGGIDLRSLNYSIGSATISYGIFLQAVVDFVIIALVIFVAIKAMSKAKALSAEEVTVEAEVPAEPSEEVQLLREIRDSLRRQT